MKNLIFVFFISIVSMSAKADVFVCSFTEPGGETVYNTETSTLTYNFEGNQSVIKNVSFEVRSPGIFKLVKDTQVLQTLKLNFQGGIGETTYPYEVIDSNMANDGSANNGNGACISNYLRAKDNN